MVFQNALPTVVLEFQRSFRGTYKEKKGVKNVGSF